MIRRGNPKQNLPAEGCYNKSTPPLETPTPTSLDKMLAEDLELAAEFDRLGAEFMAEMEVIRQQMLAECND